MKQMPNIRLAVHAVDRAGTLRIQWTHVRFPFGILHVHDSIPSVERSRPRISGGHHAIEHVDTQGDVLQDV